MPLTYAQLKTVTDRINADLVPRREALQLLEKQCALARQSLNPFKRSKTEKLTAKISDLKEEIKERQSLLLNSFSQEFDGQVDAALHQHVREVFAGVSKAQKSYHDAKGKVLWLSEMIEKRKISDTDQFYRQLQVEKMWCNNFFAAFPGLVVDEGWELTLLSMTWSRCRLCLRNSSGTICDNIWQHICLRGDMKLALVDAILLRHITLRENWEWDLPPEPITDMKSLYEAFSRDHWDSTEDIQKISYDFRMEKDAFGDYEYHFVVFNSGMSYYVITGYGGRVKAQKERPVFLSNFEHEVAYRDNGLRWQLGGKQYNDRKGFW